MSLHHTCVDKITVERRIPVALTRPGGRMVMEGLVYPMNRLDGVQMDNTSRLGSLGNNFIGQKLIAVHVANS